MSRSIAYNAVGLIIIGIIVCAFIWPLPTLAVVGTVIAIRTVMTEPWE
jgi:hypothetical protein